MKKHETSDYPEEPQAEAKPQAQAQSAAAATGGTPTPLAGVPTVVITSVPRVIGKQAIQAISGGHIRRIDLGGSWPGPINLYNEVADPTVAPVTVNIAIVEVNTAIPQPNFANYLGSVSDSSTSFLFVYSDTLTQ